MVGALCKDPVAAFDFVEGVRKLPIAIRDVIFLENLAVVLENIQPEDDKSQRHLKSFVELLAECSPNKEANYEGNPELLDEYARKIIKVIDDCGTRQKAIYIST